MSKVKGILLCGGHGTRLHPLTIVSNKHLQRIGRKMMIDYPFEKLLEAGIDEIHVVVGGEHWPPVIAYLGSGKARGVSISYSIQDEAGGIAQALGLCRTFAGEDRVCVILGDNLFDMSLRQIVRTARSNPEPSWAWLFTKEVSDPSRFGIVVRTKSGEPIDIVEKPKDPPSNHAVTGIYIFTPDVFDVIKTCRPSARGELEITDVNRWYLQKKCATLIPMIGRWTDCGTFETLHKAEQIVLGNGEIS